MSAAGDISENPVLVEYGYQAVYPQHLEFQAEKVEVEPLPEGVVIAGL